MRVLASRLVRVALALTVAFWMAGAGCLIGCEGMVAAAQSETTIPAASVPIVASGEACASMRSHDCCAKHGGKRQSTTAAKSKNTQPATSAAIADLSGTSGMMMDCPLAVNAAAALSKAKQDQSSGELVLTRTIKSITLLPEQVAALSPPARLPNRGHTYLRCCVFLI